MNENIIEVRNISKSYIINHQLKPSYGSIKDSLSGIIRKPFDGNGNNSSETFWALKDVSFEVKRGEVFGILGKNGSGKSTLLKILSRIVDPTEGEAILKGRVASLLEVGTGFHPELTGRENVFFNGSMVGMNKEEIERKFDEIVEFSEIGNFIDTPVKFYSSGMYVRLAFAVTAHLEPEVMIIDEVLAVGDAQFQKKCMNKILSAAKEGRTILFVSHSMEAIKKLCDRAILLEKGKVKYFGDSEFVSEKYIGTNMKIKEEAVFEEKKSKQAQFLEIHIQNNEGMNVETLDANESWQLYLKYKVKEPCEKAIVAVEILTQEGQTIFMTSNTDTDKAMSTLNKGIYEAFIPFNKFHFIPGTYHIRVSIQSPGVKMYDAHESTVLRIRNPNKDIRTKYFKGKYMGYIYDKIIWEIND